MRKKTVLLTVALAATLTASAQETKQKTTLWDNWYLQAGAQYDLFLGGQESKRKLLKEYHSGPDIGFAVGKWVTPTIGARIKAQGLWGKMAIDEDNWSRFKFWHIAFQPTFNVSNILFGYNPNRVYTLSVFPSGGVARNMSSNNYAMSLGVGIINNFRMSKRLSLNLEMGWSRFENDFDGFTGTRAGMVDVENHRGWDSHDNNVYAELGLQVNIGYVGFDRNKCPDPDYSDYLRRIDDLNKQLKSYKDQNAEMADELRFLLENKPEPVKETEKIIKEFITTPVSVFFELNKTVVANEKDIVNVRALANYAKQTGDTLLVTGFADSATGTPEINQRLSAKRADTVANRLVEMGISRDRIITRSYGGVDVLDPKDFNRRATVQIFKQ